MPSIGAVLQEELDLAPGYTRKCRIAEVISRSKLGRVLAEADLLDRIGWNMQVAGRQATKWGEARITAWREEMCRAVTGLGAATAVRRAMTAVAAAALALVAGACGHPNQPSTVAAPCTISALTGGVAAKQPPGWKVTWHACADGWAIAAGNSSVGFAVELLSRTSTRWHSAGIDDGAFLLVAPGHLCGDLPPHLGPPYRVRVALARRAGLVVNRCGVAPPALAAPATSPEPSLSPLQLWWDGMRPLIAAIGKAGKNLSCSSGISGNDLEKAASAALSHAENSRIPVAYDNIALALDRALALYQGAGGFCAAGESSLAKSYFSQGNRYLAQTLTAVRADGGQP